MDRRRKLDLAVIGLAAIGISIMAVSRIAMQTNDWIGIGAGIAFLAIVFAVQVKLIEMFFAGIRWINRRDDPRHAIRPPDPP